MKGGVVNAQIFTFVKEMSSAVLSILDLNDVQKFCCLFPDMFGVAIKGTSLSVGTTLSFGIIG